MNPKKLNILLLSVSSQSFFYDQVVIPFGLVSLASYVKNTDYEIKGIDMNTPPERILKRYLKVDRDLLKEIINFSPDIVAMSSYASNIYNILFWTYIIKKKIPDCCIVIGGNHASYIAKECLEKCPSLDMVVRFEGEIPFNMICENIKNKNYDFSDIPSLTYRRNGEIRENPLVDLIKNLASLPYLDRELFEDKTKSKDEFYHADIISARGCPHNCTFCNCNHYWNKIYRVRTIDSVMDELLLLKNKYPNLKSIRFRDESITINKNRCTKLSKAIIENDIKFNFQAHSRLDGLNEEVIKSLASAGFKLLLIGMESGSQKTLDRLQKGIDISRAKEVISLLRKYGINFRISFMSSTPGEKFKDTLQTIKLIKKLKLSRNDYYIGSGVDIYPGTIECEKFLKINPDYQWITKDYEFRGGKYYASRDQMGNIFQPRYYEHEPMMRIFIRIFIVLRLDPITLITYFKEGVKFQLKKIIYRFKKILR